MIKGSIIIYEKYNSRNQSRIRCISLFKDYNLILGHAIH